MTRPRRVVEVPEWWPLVRTPTEDDLLRRWATGELRSTAPSVQAGCEATLNRLAKGGPIADPWHTVEVHETPQFWLRNEFTEREMADAAQDALVLAALDALPHPWQRAALLAYYRVERGRFADLSALMGESAADELWPILAPFLGLCLAGAEMPEVVAVARGRDASAKALMARLGMAALRGGDCLDLPLILGARDGDEPRPQWSVSRLLCAAQAIVVREMRARRAA